MNTLTKIIALCALTLSLSLSINASATTFTFTAIPDEDEYQLRTRFEKVYLGSFHKFHKVDDNCL